MIGGINEDIAVGEPLGNAFVDGAFLENLLKLHPAHVFCGVSGGEEGEIGGGLRGEDEQK